MTRVFTGQGPAYNQLLIGFRHGRDHAARRARRCNEGKARAHVPRPRRRGRIELRGSLISKLKLMGGGAPKFGGKGFNLAALFGGKGLGGKSFGRKMGY